MKTSKVNQEKLGVYEIFESEGMSYSITFDRSKVGSFGFVPLQALEVKSNNIETKKTGEGIYPQGVIISGKQETESNFFPFLLTLGKFYLFKKLVFG